MGLGLCLWTVTGELGLTVCCWRLNLVNLVRGCCFGDMVGGCDWGMWMGVMVVVWGCYLGTLAVAGGWGMWLRAVVGGCGWWLWSGAVAFINYFSVAIHLSCRNNNYNPYK